MSQQLSRRHGRGRAHLRVPRGRGAALPERRAGRLTDLDQARAGAPPPRSGTPRPSSRWRRCRGGRQRDPRADAAERPRRGGDRGARARLPRARREAGRRERGGRAPHRRAGPREGPGRERRPLAALRPAGRARCSSRCAPARSATWSGSTSSAARSTRPTRAARCRRTYRDAGLPVARRRRALPVPDPGSCSGRSRTSTRSGAAWAAIPTSPSTSGARWSAASSGLGQFQLSWNAKPMQSQMIVHGTSGMLRVDLFAMFHGKRSSTPLPKAAERVVNAYADSLRPLVEVPVGAWKFVRKEVQAFQGLRDLVADFYRRLEAGRAAARLRRRGGRGGALGREGRARRPRPTTRRGSRAFTLARTADFLVTGASGRLGSAVVERLLDEGKTRARVRAPHPRRAGRGRRVLLRPPRRPRRRGPRGRRRRAGDPRRRGDGGRLARAPRRHRGRHAERGRRLQAPRRPAAGPHQLDVGGRLGRRRRQRPLDEDAPLEPRAEERGAYTRAKLEAEQLVSAAAAAGLPA